MLEKILESKSKTGLLTFFLASPERAFFLGELEKRVGGVHLSADLAAFVRMGIVGSRTSRGLRYYIVNKKSPVYAEFKGFVSKAAKEYEDELFKAIKKIGGLRFAALSGLFTGAEKMQCDILLVGDIAKKQLDDFIRGAEKTMGQELNYALMDEAEYLHRRDTFDRFMKDIFENPHIIVVDKIRK